MNLRVAQLLRRGPMLAMIVWTGFEGLQPAYVPLL